MNYNEWDNEITHVVCLPGTRTMKTFAGLVTARWIMRPDWVTESVQAGGWLPEENYGYRREVSPLAQKKFFLSHPFQSEKEEGKVAHFEMLVQLGQASIAESQEEAHYIMITDNRSTENQEGQEELTWNEFLALILAGVPGYEEESNASNTNSTSKKKAKRKKSAKEDASSANATPAVTPHTTKRGGSSKKRTTN